MSTEFSLHLVALVFVVFLITLYLLNIWLFEPLLLFMEKRNQSINQDVQEIKDSTDEVEHINNEIQEILNQARKQAKQITEEALSEAKNVYDAKMARYKAENQVKMEEFSKKLENEKMFLKLELLKQKSLFQDTLKAKIRQI